MYLYIYLIIFIDKNLIKITIAELPKVCSGHGDYASGACRCYPEWKGQECQTLWSECEDPTCSGNGRCVVGECQCYEGYAGNLCQTRKSF